MTIRVRLLEASLRYLDNMQIFTAVSGPVGCLDELYLLIERDGETVGLGELRLNMEFLTGISPVDLKQSLVDIVSMMPWNAPAEELLEQLPSADGQWSNAARSLIDATLHDAVARACNVSLAESLGGAYQPTLSTNQCIFWCDDDTLARRTAAYVKRGFTDLKLRVGIDSYERDKRRLGMMLELLPPHGRLSVDVNGGWRVDQALRRITELADLGVAYVEQPIAPGNWSALAQILHDSPVPLMLDEDLKDLDSVKQLSELQGPVAGHLKLPKLGGVGPLMEAARLLEAAGVPYMVGQMNEGACATATIIHCALATNPSHCELYGADGISNDPVVGLNYAEGLVEIPAGVGTGVQIDLQRTSIVAEYQF